MSVVYEPRNFMHDGNYPPIDDDHHDSPPDDRFADPNDAVVTDLVGYEAPHPSFADPETRLDLDPPSLPKEDSPTPTSPQRIKAIPKPERKETKDVEGRFVCTWPDCVEELKSFQRKCEWNKHMDKHDRPYKCTSEGCEKLPGFTYSGGLLRHEREVHGKHGGPKNSFNCPHINCKRHKGKGFSRLENLNEHLRRVHTQSGPSNSVETETEDVGTEQPIGPQKRKYEEEDDLREEIKRVRRENAELKLQVEAQTQQTMAMMHQLAQLQQSMHMQQQITSPGQIASSSGQIASTTQIASAAQVASTAPML